MNENLNNKNKSKNTNKQKKAKNAAKKPTYDELKQRLIKANDQDSCDDNDNDDNDNVRNNADENVQETLKQDD
jgi:hypothetical protein